MHFWWTFEDRNGRLELAERGVRFPEGARVFSGVACSVGCGERVCVGGPPRPLCGLVLSERDSALGCFGRVGDLEFARNHLESPFVLKLREVVVACQDFLPAGLALLVILPDP